MTESWLGYAAFALGVILAGLLGSVVRGLWPTPPIDAMMPEWAEPPSGRVVVLAQASVQALFRVRDNVLVAGCLVTDGEFREGTLVRVVREGLILGPPATSPGAVGQVRRHKELLAVASAGTECGVQLTDVEFVRVGDVLEAYRVAQDAPGTSSEPEAP